MVYITRSRLVLNRKWWTVWRRHTNRISKGWECWEHDIDLSRGVCTCLFRGVYTKGALYDNIMFWFQFRYDIIYLSKYFSVLNFAMKVDSNVRKYTPWIAWQGADMGVLSFMLLKKCGSRVFNTSSKQYQQHKSIIIISIVVVATGVAGVSVVAVAVSVVVVVVVVVVV